MSGYTGPVPYYTRQYGVTRRVDQDRIIVNLDAGANVCYSGSGTTWTDVSGSNNNGTLVSSPTYDYANGAFTFSGANYVLLTPNLFIPVEGRAWSVCMWIKSSQSTGGTLFAIQDTTNPASAAGYVPVLYLQTNGKIRLEPFWTSVVVASVVSAGSVNDNGWHHIAATYSSTGVTKLYIDNVFQGQDTRGQFAFANPYYYFIGAGVHGRSLGTNYFIGSISNFQFYAAELSADDVSRNFLAGA